MTTLNDIYKFLKRLLDNSVFAFLYPFLIAGVTILIVKEGKTLSYLITSSEELHQVSLDIGSSSLHGSGEEKLFKDKIGVFNDGNELIDNTDFISQNQIRFSKVGSSIKNVFICNRNRSTLMFDVIVDSLDSSSFHLTLLNNEVLEENDVVVLCVLYTGHDHIDWSVESRIKGIPDGIKPSDINSSEKRIIIWVSIILIGLVVILIFRAVLFKVYKKKFVFRNIELYSILTFLSIGGVLYYEYFQDAKILNYLF